MMCSSSAVIERNNSQLFPKINGLTDYWLAATSPAKFRLKYNQHVIDQIAIPEVCGKIIKCAEVHSKTFSMLAQEMLGTVRIYQHQVNSLYDKAFNLLSCNMVVMKQISIKRKSRPKHDDSAYHGHSKIKKRASASHDESSLEHEVSELITEGLINEGLLASKDRRQSTEISGEVLLESIDVRDDHILPEERHHVRIREYTMREINFETDGLGCELGDSEELEATVREILFHNTSGIRAQRVPFSERLERKQLSSGFFSSGNLTESNMSLTHSEVHGDSRKRMSSEIVDLDSNKRSRFSEQESQEISAGHMSIETPRNMPNQLDYTNIEMNEDNLLARMLSTSRIPQDDSIIDNDHSRSQTFNKVPSSTPLKNRANMRATNPDISAIHGDHSKNLNLTNNNEIAIPDIGELSIPNLIYDISNLDDNNNNAKCYSQNSQLIPFIDGNNNLTQTTNHDQITMELSSGARKRTNTINQTTPADEVTADIADVMANQPPSRKRRKQSRLIIDDIIELPARTIKSQKKGWTTLRCLNPVADAFNLNEAHFKTSLVLLSQPCRSIKSETLLASLKKPVKTVKKCAVANDVSILQDIFGDSLDDQEEILGQRNTKRQLTTRNVTNDVSSKPDENGPIIANSQAQLPNFEVQVPLIEDIPIDVPQSVQESNAACLPQYLQNVDLETIPLRFPAENDVTSNERHSKRLDLTRECIMRSLLLAWRKGIQNVTAEWLCKGLNRKLAALTFHTILDFAGRKFIELDKQPGSLRIVNIRCGPEIKTLF